MYARCFLYVYGARFYVVRVKWFGVGGSVLIHAHTTSQCRGAHTLMCVLCEFVCVCMCVPMCTCVHVYACASVCKCVLVQCVYGYCAIVCVCVIKWTCLCVCVCACVLSQDVIPKLQRVLLMAPATLYHIHPFVWPPPAE